MLKSEILISKSQIDSNDSISNFQNQTDFGYTVIVIGDCGELGICVWNF